MSGREHREHEWRWGSNAISGTCSVCGLIGAWRVKEGQAEAVKMFLITIAIDGEIVGDWEEKEPPCPGK
jgi:hypothetical protein